MKHNVVFVLVVCFSTSAWALDHQSSADTIQIENSSDAKVTDNCFLSVSELTEPEDFIGTLIVEDRENGGEYFALIAIENGREVQIVLNNVDDPFYQKKESNAYQNMQGVLKKLVGRRVKIVGQLVSGMKLNNGNEEFARMPMGLDHLTFHWLRVINVEETK